MMPLLSIVIPTRNRQKYCISAIEDILSYTYQEFELCIQDNSDDEQIAEYLANRNPDPRLVYKRIPQQICSIFNINNSVSLANGKYVLLIGDDDTILPNIFSTVEWADSQGIDSICPTVNVEYLWPEAVPNHPDGILIIPSFTNTKRAINVDSQLRKLFAKGIVNYQSYMLPKVYHGIIRRDKLKEIEARTGSFFCGLSPDISGCVALSAVVKNHIVIDYPITVAGACSSSSTAQNMNKDHRGKLSSAPHLYLRGEYHWDRMVPPFYSVETIWADSALHAVDAMKLEELRNEFNFSRLAAYAILRNRSMWRFALTVTLNDKGNPYNRGRLHTLISIGVSAALLVGGKVLRAILIKRPIVYQRLENITNISQAVKVFNLNNQL